MKISDGLGSLHKVKFTSRVYSLLLLEFHQHLQHTHTASYIVVAHLTDFRQKLTLYINSFLFSNLLESFDNPILLQRIEVDDNSLASELLQTSDKWIVADKNDRAV